MLKWLLRKIIMLWIKPIVLPKSVEDLNLKKDLPICFVLKQKSIIDKLVSEHFIASMSLPKPQNNMRQLDQTSACWASLDHTGVFKKVRRKSPPSAIVTLLKKINSKEISDIQIVPITVIWGRGPESKDKSAFQLLFSDDENAGFLQKIFLTFVQGKNSYFEISKPFSLKDLISENQPVAETAKKTRRILRVHFARQRTAVLGPATESVSSIYRKIISSKKVQKLIGTDTTKSEKLTKEALGYLKEIISKQNASTIRAFNIVLARVWSKIFNGFFIKGEDKLTALSKTHTIVYLPCHKSHLDYLLNGYLANQTGLPVPYFAAGKNLDFFPIGPLLRRGGAFFLRRSFGGKKLYTTVFKEYLSYLISSGFHMTAFIEGGRSRTGRLLQPKTGILSMIIQGYCQDPVRPVVFIPTYIGYDKIVEFKSYHKELQGQKKNKESFLGFLKIWRIFISNYGKIYINYGQPIFLQDSLNRNVENWQDFAHEDKPVWLSKLSMKVASQAMEKIASANIVSPIDISSLLFLNRNSRTITKKDFLYFVKHGTELISALWDESEISTSYCDENEALRYLEKSRVFTTKENNTNNLLSVDDKNLIYFTYYRNETLHLFVIPSLLCQILSIHNEIDINLLTHKLAILYTVLRDEFFLPWETLDTSAIKKVLQPMIAANIVTFSKETVQLNREGPAPRFVNNLKSIFERSALLASIMIFLIKKNNHISVGDLKGTLQQLLSGISVSIGHKMDFDQVLFNATLNRLNAAGFITLTIEQSIQSTETFDLLSESSSSLLNPKLSLYLEENT